MIIVGVLLFALLVVVHEFGHFWAAKKSGVEVEEFGIGFPPRLLGMKFGKSRTLYSLNLIPLGGFVKLKGEAAADKLPRSFGAARFRHQAKILLAGVGMNIVAAFGLILILSLVGLPQLLPNQFTIKGDEHDRQQTVLVADVLAESAAAGVGLLQGDRILTVDGQTMTSSDLLVDYTRARPGQSIRLGLERGGKALEQSVTLGRTEEGKGQLGIVPAEDLRVRYTWAAPVVALVITAQLLLATVLGLWQIIVGLIVEGTASEAVAGAVGPVGILALLGNAGNLGWQYVVLLIVAISVSLAVVNALPLPALDGGRLALISLYRFLKRPLTKQLENAVHTIGFVLLLALFVLVSYFDVKRFF
ncbi:site-2 protease family protein [Candidatus Microgenomates bacterium]|nr:site-2 protease family protein [Candidatus Microgenomates bacterium]